MFGAWEIAGRYSMKVEDIRRYNGISGSTIHVGQGSVDVEPKLGLAAKDADAMSERGRQCRRVIHEVRVDPARQADHAAASTWPT